MVIYSFLPSRTGDIILSFMFLKVMVNQLQRQGGLISTYPDTSLEMATTAMFRQFSATFSARGYKEPSQERKWKFGRDNQLQQGVPLLLQKCSISSLSSALFGQFSRYAGACWLV
jgi:hypothetical protein